MAKTCSACGGAVCEICGGCVAHGECSCMEDQIQKYIDRAEVAEARLSLTEKNAAKILDEYVDLKIENARLVKEYNKWRIIAGKLYEDKVYMRAALRDIYEACMAADADGELDSRIDGGILDAARVALEKKGGEE